MNFINFSSANMYPVVSHDVEQVDGCGVLGTCDKGGSSKLDDSWVTFLLLCVVGDDDDDSGKDNCEEDIEDDDDGDCCCSSRNGDDLGEDGGVL